MVSVYIYDRNTEQQINESAYLMIFLTQKSHTRYNATLVITPKWAGTNAGDITREHCMLTNSVASEIITC
jgi:hypothetical protein